MRSWHRPVAAALAVLLVASTSGAALTHNCPEHRAPAADAVESAVAGATIPARHTHHASGSAATAMPDADGREVERHAHHASDQPGARGDRHGDHDPLSKCHCVGACHGGGSAQHAQGYHDMLADVAAPYATRTAAPAPAAPPTAAPYFIPFAHGPPASV